MNRPKVRNAMKEGQQSVSLVVRQVILDVETCNASNASNGNAVRPGCESPRKRNGKQGFLGQYREGGTETLNQ